MRTEIWVVAKVTVGYTSSRTGAFRSYDGGKIYEVSGPDEIKADESAAKHFIWCESEKDAWEKRSSFMINGCREV